ncbi:CsiV family protein [Kangiella sp. HZ709]|uniref:CsiV family protein n=1 Tax=Kangiella sp. HZ709 TaxID=2666328 RepID=UPI0012AFB500|nr:CsiV family protein [Kangiella sp. HZ709]MRX26965.1 hypothetical protein [Kangiella sp. HZ709]
MKRIITLIALVCGLLITNFTFSNSAKAQTVFDVEFVFFKRLDADGQLNYLAKDENLVFRQNYTLNQPISLPEGYQSLKRSERRLEGVFKRLRASANMRPLLHLGWRQPLENKENVAWLSFSVSDEPEQKGLLDFIGKIRFSRNKGLLIESQINGFRATLPTNFTEDDDNTSGTSGLDSENTNEESEEDLSEVQIPDPLAGHFLLEENRKIKINALNYFDHPTMGILIKVTPYQATIEQQDALEAEQALQTSEINKTNKESE